MKKLKVKHSGFVKLLFYDDFPDGNLVIGEAIRNIPFQIKRFYFINYLFNPKAIRGLHAHKKAKQAIFCINGSFDLHLDDGHSQQKIRMDDPGVGILLGPGLWHAMKRFSRDCLILVVASDYYKESDYIRNYQEFLKYARSFR
ncbi:MAG: fatty-acid oxidation protein subunit alpha [Candidatus Doudnabacteria bacterium RIFCSPHIGHO2_01_FULL_49_9]|uniref:Fatty-acid oxidation protein subunit alpha n=1 Tax=Candidatus Doudnabacteria bacterium RIFCSPHIGHO2_01_FULL_49_9 TaxID=1817827 RepID=A0A1F5NYD4_9BACT|nr:MAG: fatty-acid oxidation protein subunit alpha [Candidatus Doudnabacteria bacterium RIFCSPHIGHO2_01_FULL_49_9]